jgi:DNA-binding protein HU-alpha
MTRTELIEALAGKTGMDKREVKSFLEALTSLVEGAIRQGDEVPLKGLGKFRVQHRKARTGRNPITGEAIQIPAKTVVKFSLARSLKELA